METKKSKDITLLLNNEYGIGATISDSELCDVLEKLFFGDDKNENTKKEK